MMRCLLRAHTPLRSRSVSLASLVRPLTANSGLVAVPSTRRLSSVSPSHPSSRIAIEQLLQTVGSEEDQVLYKTLYADQPDKLAVIKVGGEVMMYELETFAKALTFLKSAGLFPIIVHGAGPQMNDYMKENSIEPHYIGGLRVTDASTLAVARKIFRKVNLQLVDELHKWGTLARPVVGGVLQAVQANEELGFVGEITGVDTSPIESAIRAGAIPVVSSLAESDSGQVLNVNADVVARELSINLKPYKTVFITSKGGWPDDETKKILPSISMSKDYEEMAARDYTGRQGTLLKLNELKLILDNLPAHATVSLTSAAGLTRELFSHRCVGTVVRK